MGMLTGAATVKQCMELSQKAKNRTIIWPRNSALGFIFEKAKNINLERCKLPSVHSMILDNSQDMAATCSPTDEYGVCVCTHMHTQIEYYSAIKNNKILPFAATWMDLEGTVLCEMS